MGQFHNTRLKLEMHDDGENFDLLEYLYFTSDKFGDLRTMTSSDGISSPRIVSNIIQCFGKLLWSGIMHDGGYRDKLERQNKHGDWVHFTLTQEECDDLIDECMQAQGANQVEKYVIYTALHELGVYAFKKDRKK